LCTSNLLEKIFRVAQQTGIVDNKIDFFIVSYDLGKSRRVTYAEMGTASVKRKLRDRGPPFSMRSTFRNGVKRSGQRDVHQRFANRPSHGMDFRGAHCPQCFS
jgi:hypothetical protein